MLDRDCQAACLLSSPPIGSSPPPPSIPPFALSAAALQPPMKLTHAYVATLAHVHACTWARSPFAGRGGESGPKARWGSDKSSGLFHKCATHHVQVCSLCHYLSLSPRVAIRTGHNRRYKHLRGITREYCVNAWDRKCVRLLCRRLNFVVDRRVSRKMEAQLVCCSVALFAAHTRLACSWI